MAGLLSGGDYNPDPLAMGLLGLGSALMTPRQMGGGLMAGANAFTQQAMLASEMRRRMAADAERAAMLRERNEMDRKRFGFDVEQAEAAKAQRQQEAARMADVEQWVTQNRPDLLPAFKLNPGAVASQLMPKQKEPIKLGQGDQLLDPESYKPLATNPKEAPPDEFERALRAAGIDPASPQGQALAMQRARKLASHAPAASTTVYTGTMVPVERPDGTRGYVMPSKDGSILELPGVQPPGTAKEKEAAETNTRSALDRSKLMLDKIDSAMSKVGFGTTAIPGAVMGKVPGTGAYDLRAEVETIKANFGFQELQQMRASSPTGGALGQVAVQELAMLQAAVQNLDPNQSPAQLRRNLEAAKRHVTNWRNAVQMSGNKAPAAPTQQRSPDGRSVTGTIGAAPAKSIDDLLKQYGD